MSILSHDDRSSFEAEIRDWAQAKAIFDFSFAIHPAMTWGINMGIKASAVVTIPPSVVDDEGLNLDPNKCDCGKGEFCPLWDAWTEGETKWTAIYRNDGQLIWWEQRAML